jgi:hypothetical protein
MPKGVVAFLLGFLAILVAFGAGESTGSMLAAVCAVGVFSFLSQFFLARGERVSIRKGWPRALAMSMPLWILMFMTIAEEEPRVQIIGTAACAALAFLAALAGVAMRK